MITGLVGSLLAACGSSPPPQVELRLSAGEAAAFSAQSVNAHLAQSTVTIALPLVTIEAKIDGNWRTLESERRQVMLELGPGARSTSLLDKAFPGGALTGLRLGFGTGADHFDVSADCLGKIPSCAHGAIKLVLQNPRSCVAGAKHGDVRLILTGFDVDEGDCTPSPPPPPPSQDLGSSDADAACVGIVCPPQQVCRAGSCVPSNSCTGVICPPGQTCDSGRCVELVDMTAPADLSTPPDLSHQCSEETSSCPSH
jgi:hypothetical protein